MKDQYAKDGEVYKEAFKNQNNDSPLNVVTIASRRAEVYIETMLKKFQKFDQIEICCVDRYLDKAIVIIQMWEAVGVEPIKKRIEFTKAEEDILNRQTQKMYKKPVNRITLTKIPELFRFTEQ